MCHKIKKQNKKTPYFVKVAFQCIDEIELLIRPAVPGLVWTVSRHRQFQKQTSLIFRRTVNVNVAAPVCI